MYAFGLVLWEIARRCVTGGKLCVYPISVSLFLVEGASTRSVFRIVFVIGTLIFFSCHV